MAIHVMVKDSDIRRDGIWLHCETTNDDFVGEKKAFSMVFTANETALSIKATIDTLVSLYWQAYSTTEWTV